MFKNYFKTAFRNLWRYKFLSATNILGLSVGIACCMLIALYVVHEKSYDRFNTNADRIVRATMELSYNGNLTKIAVTGTKVLPEFKRNFPEVENGVRTYPVSAIVQYDDKLLTEKQFVYSTPEFFDIFSFRLLQGDPRKVLVNPNQLVMTASTAKKYFGNENAVGKVVRVNNTNDFVVSGVMEDCPANSQIKFTMLASWNSLTDEVFHNESWMDASHYTYLLLKKPGMHEALQQKIEAYFKADNENFGVAGKNYLNIKVQPLTDVHLKAVAEGGFEPGSDYRYIYIFSIAALLILIIACANYVNLTIARASERAKEVGVRKAAGASRKQLVVQFICESVFTVLTSVLISVLLVKLFLPLFNTIAGKEIGFGSLLQPAFLVAMGIILLLIGFISSVYPALILSGFNPVRVLKGNNRTRNAGLGLRKSLFVMQFFISVTLIISTLVIRNQLSFIQNKKLGYDNDRVLVLRSDAELRKKMSTVKSELMANTSVLGVTTCNQTPTFIPGKYNAHIDEKDVLISGVRVDKDFIKTMGMDVVSGDDFTTAEQEAAFAETDTIVRPLIINEAAAKSFGWSANEAVGKRFRFQGRNSVVKGVVGDFHFTSMHETIAPIIIFLSEGTSKILVKLSGNDITSSLNYMKQKWSTLAPHLPFEYEFLDEQFGKLYGAEKRTGSIFYAFTILAIGLACLGLLGLITFSVNQRTKEIGIRKVLGASVAGIMILLSKDFLKLVIIAIIAAMPVAWWAADKWLQDFAYRINIGWWIFIVAGVMALLIAIITVSLQAIRAASANPVKSLRTE